MSKAKQEAAAWKNNYFLASNERNNLVREVEQLREAMKRIAHGKFPGRTMDGADVLKRLSRRDMKRIARAALQQEEVTQ